MRHQQMKIFITGAGGFIGKRLAIRLANEGYNLNVLLRNPSRDHELGHKNITVFPGDILNRETIARSMEGCNQIYHLAALAKMWVADDSLFRKINVDGTNNVMEVAKSLGVTKLIFTSTAGVFPPAINGEVNEQAQKRPDLYTMYEKTKNESEDLVKKFPSGELCTAIVNPTNVFGPGPISDSNMATRMIRDYINGKWKFIPSDGNQVMNYVYIEDVVTGMIKAMELAPKGSQYILGGENASYHDLFNNVRELLNIHHRLYGIPVFVIKALAYTEKLKSFMVTKPPLITPEWARKIPYNWSKDINKARKELNYNPRSFKDGIRDTVEWLMKTQPK